MFILWTRVTAERPCTTFAISFQKKRSAYQFRALKSKFQYEVAVKSKQTKKKHKQTNKPTTPNKPQNSYKNRNPKTKSKSTALSPRFFTGDYLATLLPSYTEKSEEATEKPVQKQTTIQTNKHKCPKEQTASDASQTQR